jgi:uncharacterized protein (TIGR02118 family)
MIKSHSFMPRRPDVSEEEFSDHWLNVHGPLALRIDTLRRYVQCHRLPAGNVEAGEIPYSGVAEVWFDDLEEGRSLRAHPAFVDSVERDELEFIDVPNMRHLLTTQELCDGEPAARDEPGVKLMMMLRRPPGADAGELRERWAAADERAAGRAVGAVRHARCIAIPEAYADGEPVYDGVRELWFGDEAAAGRAPDLAPDAWRALMAPPGVDPATTAVIATREHRLIWPIGPIYQGVHADE